MGRDSLLSRVHLLFGCQHLYYISLLVPYMGRQIVFYSVLWVANYQLLRTTAQNDVNLNNFFKCFRRWFHLPT